MKLLLKEGTANPCKPLRVNEFDAFYINAGWLNFGFDIEVFLTGIKLYLGQWVFIEAFTYSAIMVKNLLLFFCFSCFSAPLFAQDADTTTNKQAASIDTAAILQNLLFLLDSAGKPSSYGLISASVGNRLFSLRNQQLNAKQSGIETLVFTPALGYFHKSGFSLSAGTSLLNDRNKGFGPTQYSITPAFDLLGSKTFTLGISYSRYFVVDKYSDYSSPIQNDLYGYITYKKTWLEPGLAIGFSSGKYTDINKFTLQFNGNTYVDTGTYKIRSFSIVASVSHDFEWSSVFGSTDGFSLTPSLQMNFAADSTQSLSHTIGQNLVRFLKRKQRLRPFLGKNSFQAQSVALSLDLNYTIGKFSVLPQVYLDYYLPETDEKRFTQIFALAVGYAF